jgi:hypothetical protein
MRGERRGFYSGEKEKTIGPETEEAIQSEPQQQEPGPASARNLSLEKFVHFGLTTSSFQGRRIPLVEGGVKAWPENAGA